MALLYPRPTLQQLPRFPLTAAEVETLTSAADFRQVLLQQIARARQRIYLTALYLQDDDAGHEVMEALLAARRAHPELDVRVLVDWHRAQRGLIGAGKQAGNAAWYRASSDAHDGAIPVYGVPVQTRELFGVLHLKGFVFDDTVLYSGASLNEVYLQYQDKYRHDRYHLLHCRELADALVNFTRQYLLSSPAVHRLDQADCPPTRLLRREIRLLRRQLAMARYDVSHASLEAQNGLAVTPLIGIGRNNPLNRHVLDLLSSARERVIICTPYFNFPKPVTREINRLIQRGVQLEIIVGDKTANDFFIPPHESFKAIGALPYLYEVNLRRFAKQHRKALLNGQLKLHLWKDGTNSFHLKGIWVDDHYHLLTGNNLNPRAFSLDLENALLIHDPHGELQALKQQELDAIHRHTRTIQQHRELETLRQYPERVRKLLTRLSRVRIDRLIYRIL
ncbi:MULTISPECIES: CDP-diacylglycerol--serine O-phosphatidyltransferase [unclassified Paludibacterium]|uniref:CDP-diacylglycerol--serine O-phosphatidyltransferase n=1 Tax=unclassified Paludibacterium TaxID=2618429 RepID=UPI001C05264C|nr:CDP-diacylglycerol--serine O-phosphatidyltransferase [Paludibacterium sp. B53371]BEV72058.1 CDP-diacylglycerol--serine O-phosphatidyltransferase [Paludibacterium sp. THUN1379]